MKHNEISVRRGTEGPRHDPYSYEEITVNGRIGKVTYHGGLAEWCEGPGFKCEGDGSAEMFERATGISIGVAHKAIDKMEDRKLRKHYKHGGMEWESGYPGEKLLVCKCGEIVDYIFNRSVIE